MMSEATEQRQKCDADGWCFVMSAAVDASSGVRKGFYVAQMLDRSNPSADLKQELVYGLRNHNWAPPRLCPFCEGNPNARFVKADEVTR
jgi:hypothetical protein